MAWDVVGQDSTGNLSVVKDPPPNGYHILPGSGGPYPTQAQANTALQALTGVINTPEPLIPGTKIQVPSIPNPLSGIAAVGDFFQRLTQASTWLRIFEIVIGVVLVGVGIASMTKTVPLATGIAKVMA
jgi:hypothetical protein